MSRQVYAKQVFLTLEPATSTNHDGSVYVRDDLPANSVYIISDEGEYYVERGDSPSVRLQDCLKKDDKRNWPKPILRNDVKVIPLYRDYWQITGNPGMHDSKQDLSPYDQALVNTITKRVF